MIDLRSCATRLAGVAASVVLGIAPAATVGDAQSPNAACPDGTLRFGVEPYEDAALLAPAYQPLADALGASIGCKVDLMINAELVATFSDQYGNPATYTATIATYPGSGITDISQLAGRSFAYSDPASTSGHLYPAFALKSHGIDPDAGVQAVFAGSHTASFEALRNHTVDAGELNSDRIAAATLAGEYSPLQFVALWESAPIPQDPITVRGDLPNDAKQQIRHDVNFDQIRSLVSTLNIDLASLS